MFKQTRFGRSVIARAMLAIALCLFTSGSAWADADQALRNQGEAEWQRYQDLRLKTRVPAKLYPAATGVRLLIYNVDLADTPANRKFIQEGAMLTPSEVKALRGAVFFAPQPPADVGCCIPRHAFLFLNNAGEEIGRFDVCFECGCAVIHGEKPPKPDLTDVDWDSRVIGSIVRARKFPVDFGYDSKTRKEIPKP